MLASNAGFLKKQIEYILKGPLWEVFCFPYLLAVRIFGEAYIKEEDFPELLAVHLKENVQSLLVLLAAKACRFPIWLRPLWMCATWISTLFWKQLQEEKKEEKKVLNPIFKSCIWVFPQWKSKYEHTQYKNSGDLE